MNKEANVRLFGPDEYFPMLKNDSDLRIPFYQTVQADFGASASVPGQSPAARDGRPRLRPDLGG
jgi:hypothetical protein